MRRSWHLLAALGLVLGLGGCATPPLTAEEEIASQTSDFKVALRKAVADEERARKFERKLTELEAIVLEFRQQAERFHAELQRINANYDAQDDEFVALFDKTETERKAVRDKMLDIHFEMLALTTPQEWKALAKHERKLVEAGQYRGE